MGSSSEGHLKLVEEQSKKSVEKHACSVYITCGHPTGDGKMKVEMKYEGDPHLAAFLLENAHDHLAPDLS